MFIYRLEIMGSRLTFSLHADLDSQPARLKYELIPVPIELLDIRRRGMRVGDNEDHLLDVRNLIHKEAILSRCSNAETRWYRPIVARALYRVDTSVYD